MKKYLFGAMALPLLFACSSEDFEKEVISNDQFAGIEKVDATLFMDEGPVTRMATAWAVEYGDKFGFAWLGGGEAVAKLAIDGNAWQNHPLTVVNDATRGKIFKPETSIYVGNYFLYYPYDYDTKNIEKIKFNSLAVQPLANGANETWNDVAKNAILIGDKWTEVKAAGTTISGKVWDKAGIDNPFQIFSAFFSNQTALDLTYFKNNPAFAAAKAISGATDINYTIAAGETVGAADIYSATVKLNGAAKSFTYAPTAQPNGAAHNGNFWENKKDLNTTLGATAGFTFADGAADVITLNAPAGAPVSTGAEGNKGWFWFNSLPVTAGDGASGSNVRTVFTTSYGTVTVDQTLAQCAWAYEDLTPAAANHEIGGTAWAPSWIKLDAADAAPTAVAPRKWDPTAHQTFINQYGNHKGKYAFQVDFSTGVMDGMDINDDAHLQKALKYYIASGKGEVATLDLLPASATDNSFKLSKISIALLQTINSAADKVLVNPGALKIIVTQDGQADLGLADKKEVPALNNVFSAATSVYLSKDCDWTWSGRSATAALDYKAAIPVDNMVNSIINEGTPSTKLTVDAENIELYNTDTDAKAATTLKNEKGATMTFTKVTTVQNNLTNLGTINVGAADNTAAELRAYNATVTNDATALNASGTINNYGVVGKSAGTSGIVNNYGKINMLDAGAITLLRTNEKGATPFAHPFTADTYMMGTVVLPEGNPYALVSVSNGDETGFIKYTWTGATYTHDGGNVKYNTLVINRPDNQTITFTGANATEIKYLEFNGVRTQVVNPTASDKLPNLKGVIVNAEKSIIIEKTNQLVCSDGAFLGNKATVYLGGVFTYVGTNNYFGTWTLDQIVEW